MPEPSRGCSMPFVVVGHGCVAALLHRQPGLGAVQRLYPGILIETQHHGMCGRRNIQAHDVMQLLDKGGVLRQFEDTPAMRREPMRNPDPLHSGDADPTTFAITRAVQWLASCGGGAWVSRTTSAVLLMEIRALPGGRVLSLSRPSIPVHMPQIRKKAIRRESQTGLFRLGQSTRDRECRRRPAS